MNGQEWSSPVGGGLDDQDRREGTAKGSHRTVAFVPLLVESTILSTCMNIVMMVASATCECICRCPSKQSQLFRRLSGWCSSG